MARPDLALEFGRKVLTIDPGDTETLSGLIDFLLQPGKSDSAAAESHS